MSRSLGIWLILIVVLALVAGFVSLSSAIPPRLGLDLSGGTQVLLEAVPAPGQTLDSTTMDRAQQIIENRVNAFGLTEPVVQVAGSNRILVELPNEKDPARAVGTIQQTGRLEFVEVDVATGSQLSQLAAAAADGQEPIIRTSTSPTPTVPVTATQSVEPTATPTLGPAATAVVSGTATVTETAPVTPTTAGGVDPLAAQFGPVFPTLFTGDQLDPALLTIGRDQSNRSVVNFGLKPEAAQKFADYTTANVGGYLCIVLDNRVNSCPVINEPIPSGQGQISVGGDLQEAQDLLTVLRYGSLPVSLHVVSSSTVGPTLGTQSIDDSLVAGVIGLAAVAVFMVVYYRLPGVIAVIALLIYTATLIALFKIIPVTLTLPGIAGLILSIGVAVDANVLIFERMKEELRAGRHLAVAVDVGFQRAWPSIRDSNVSTLITCTILFYFGSTFGASMVKGFAITLALGVLVSLLTAIWVTRALLHLMMDRADFSKRHSLFGV